MYAKKGTRNYKRCPICNRPFSQAERRMNKYKPGDYLEIITSPGRRFLVTSNYHGGSMIECQEILANGELGNGYSPFEFNTKPSPSTSEAKP